MTITTKKVLTQYMTGTGDNSVNDETCEKPLHMLSQAEKDALILYRVKKSADPITFEMKRKWKTSDFISLLNSKEKLICFLHQLDVLFKPRNWGVICSTFSAAKLLYEASVTIEQSFRIDEIIENILSFLITSGIEQWIEEAYGWKYITTYYIETYEIERKCKSRSSIC